ncbi:MAG: hypothetical protein QNJ12_06075 [Ilumatobacter sp.]|uniref:hypothetical protein n=1 Tax=Ilumatobacter sp. TaxID=1967498 RepID=UPI00260F0A29|nr:hypothetical protein [Ilumatobacter sp.]MDJ0768339.1 hypothetical protein [Ilumatobacter sp.]
MTESSRDDELAALQAEVDRLRSLVGPAELSYTQLQEDVLACRDAAKGAEANAGMLRGRVRELEVDLARARQDQAHFQRAVLGVASSARSRLSRAIRSRVL